MPKPIKKELIDFGLKTQMVRKKNRLTQRQLAERLDISFVYMGYIEQGREKPSERLLQKIREILEF